MTDNRPAFLKELQGEPCGIHGRGCPGPMYRNRFGVEYCSWCGFVVPLVPVSRLRKDPTP